MFWNEALLSRPVFHPLRDFPQPSGRLDALWRQLRSGTGALNQPEPSGLNVWSREDALVVALLAPGVPQDGFDLTIEGRTLTIQGRRAAAAKPPAAEVNPQAPAQSPAGDSAVRRRERPSGEFTRTLRLPFPVHPEEVKARLTQGILWMELPRAAEDRPRKIAVQAETE